MDLLSSDILKTFFFLYILFEKSIIMQKLNDINEAVSYLREGDIITGNGKDLFMMKNKRIYRYCEGTQFGLSIKDFMELYNKNTFYLYEESVEIDESKDEAYYRYYRK